MIQTVSAVVLPRPTPLLNELVNEDIERGSAGIPPEEARMAAMKPRTGDGPLEVTKEGRGIVMRVPLEGGGRLVVEMSVDEANALGDALKSAAG
jgi:hypothetical protein